LMPDLVVSVSCTTRQPRRGERDGVDYHFISRRAFRARLRRGLFAEWACVYGNYYGTSKSFLDKNLAADRQVLLTIDTQGGLQIRKGYPGALLIGILPPSRREQAQRLAGRGETEAEAEKRLREASEERLVLRTHYDVRLINRDVAATAARLSRIIART